MTALVAILYFIVIITAFIFGFIKVFKLSSKYVRYNELKDERNLKSQERRIKRLEEKERIDSQERVNYWRQKNNLDSDQYHKTLTQKELNWELARTGKLDKNRNIITVPLEELFAQQELAERQKMDSQVVQWANRELTDSSGIKTLDQSGRKKIKK